MTRTLSLLAVLAFAAPLGAEEKDADKDWTGKLVMLRADGVRSGTPTADGRLDRGTDFLSADDVYKVRIEKDGLLELVGAGWVAKADAVTVDDAAAVFTDRIKDKPDDASLYGRRALAFQYKGRTETAVRADGPAAGEAKSAAADFAEAIRLDPGNYFWWAKRGWFRLQRGEYDKAAADYGEVVRLQPAWAPGYQGRGVAHESKREYDLAVADYTRALELDPRNAYYLNSRGVARFALKAYDKALEDFTAAVETRPTFALALANRGSAWHAKREYDKALADFDRALELDPRHTRALSARGDTWRAKKDHDKAVADYDKAFGFDPADPTPLGGKALVLARQRKYDDARKAYEAAMRLDPADWLYRDYAVFLATCPDGKYRDAKKAVELARKAADRAGAGADAQYHAALAAAYAESGDFERAVAEQKKALDDPALDADGRNEMTVRLKLYEAKKPYRDQ